MVRTVRSLALGAALLAALPGSASAEVTAAADDGFTIEMAATAALDRDAAWDRLLDIGGWWADSHTYSGSAKALHLDAVPGGCWCETWPAGEVEHGRVTLLMPNETLRFRTELGPLQQLGVTGALTFTLTDTNDAGQTAIRLVYRVGGSSLSNLKALAPAIDQVLAEQLSRLAGAPTTR